MTVPGRPVAELVAPGHPLLEAVIDLLGERSGPVLRQGAVLVDDGDADEAARVLVYLEHTVVDGRDVAADGQRVASRRFEFVELAEDGTAKAVGSAPYLDHRPATAVERRLLAPVLDSGWLKGDLEAAAFDHAVAEAVPAHLAQVRARTLARVTKAKTKVRERLTAEVHHWDDRANVLAEQAAAGTTPRMNPDRARARADELADRLRRRMAELEREEQLQALPPVVVGAALVVPAGLVARLSGERDRMPATHARETARVERRAVDAVLAAEDALGRHPREMPHNNPGYDIRSTTPDGHLLFVEVKGRISGADSFTVTRTEILTGLNSAERFVLALVDVRPEEHGGGEEVRYLRNPFWGTEDTYFDMTSVTYPWRTFWDRASPPS